MVNHKEDISTKPKFKLSILAKQIITGLIVGGAVISILYLILMQIFSNPVVSGKKRESSEVEEGMHRGIIETVGEQMDPQEIWRYKMKEESDRIKNELNQIKEVINQSADSDAYKTPTHDPELESLRGEIEHLKSLLEERDKTNFATNGMMGAEKAKEVGGIRRIKIALTEQNEENKIKHKEDTIPAGSFARAVILGGIDASTALSSSSDPRPLLIRLTDAGTLPRKFQSDLKDCHIMASGYGDLSSERVFARLEKLTCIERTTGEVVETIVEGYIAGEDGRAGIKGTVVEKGRGYLAKSVLGGVLQGLAGVLNPERSVTVSPVAALVPKRTTSQKFTEGMTTGAVGSMIDCQNITLIEQKAYSQSSRFQAVEWSM